VSDEQRSERGWIGAGRPVYFAPDTKRVKLAVRAQKGQAQKGDAMDLLLMAAGFGSRLKDRTKALPKALIEVAGETLLDRVLDRAEALDWIERVIVVTGFERDKMLAQLDARVTEKPVVELFNADYQKGNFYSLTTGLAEVGESFLLSNVDHIYPLRLMEHVRAQFRGVGAICDSDRPLLSDCMKVLAQPGSTPPRVQRIDKGLTEHDWGYIGMTAVTAEGRDAYMAAAARVQARGNEKAWAEMVLGDLAQRASEDERVEAPLIIDASGFGWLEVDDGEDLAKAEATLAEQPDFLR